MELKSFFFSFRFFHFRVFLILKKKNNSKKNSSSYVPLSREQRERGAVLLRDAAERGWLLSTVDPDSIRPLEDDEFKLVSRY